MKDILKRVAAGTTTVEDAYRLEMVLTQLARIERLWPDPAVNNTRTLEESMHETLSAVRQLLRQDLHAFQQDYPREYAVLERVFGGDLSREVL